MAFIDGAPQKVSDLLALLDEAIAARLTPEDVAARWSAVPTDDVLRELRNSVIFALEHVPYERDGTVGGPRWQGSVDREDLEACVRQLQQLDADDPATPLPPSLHWPMFP